MYQDILSYLKSAQDAHPMLAGIGGAIMYVLFPEQAFLTSCLAIVTMMALDIITKYYAISVKHGGFWRSIRTGNISSNCMWEGTSRKIFTYMVIFIMVGLAYRVSPLESAASLLGTAVYTILFLRECQSVVENLLDAGADVGWLSVIIKKKTDEILKEEGVDEDER